ncbi:MAG TPA: hypothetical protein VMG13_01535 [Trebonia sp.]|nr:hypothetical protein [Trebonia sp.]
MAILITVTNMYPNYGPGSTMPGAQSPQPPAPGRPPRGGRSRAAKIAALVVTCGVVAGGAFAVTELVSGSGQTAAPASSGTAAAAGPTGQAAVLNDALSDASSTTTSTPAPARIGRALIRLRLLGGMYGQYTFETKKGSRTLAFERGTILSIAGNDVTVRAANGTTWTWVLTSASIVREDGTRTSASSLASGQLVLAAGPVTGTTRDARLVVIRSAAKSQAS